MNGGREEERDGREGWTEGWKTSRCLHRKATE